MKGMCADIAIHDTGTGNPHAHVMLTMRPFNEDKSWGDKQKKEYILDPQGEKIYDPKKRSYKCKSIPTTDWNSQDNAEVWRAAWSETANQYLKLLKHDKQLDHRSYKRQGIARIPTIHLGAESSQMEKRGIRTERGDINRAVEVTNKQLRQLYARIKKLRGWLKEEMENTAPPTLADVITNILNQRESEGKKSHYSTISSVKAAANILNFLSINKITDMAGLEEKVKAMHDKQSDIREKLKPVEQRLRRRAQSRKSP
jgi:chaperonin cofactor prefoldin